MKKSKSLVGTNEAYNESMRYVQNAADILKTKAGKKDKFYSDKKYVRMAGNTLYNGVLEALDYKFPNIQTGKGRPSVIKYKEELAKSNKKILVYYTEIYNQAHLYMGYDGGLSYNVAKEAFENAQVVINWATA